MLHFFSLIWTIQIIYAICSLCEIEMHIIELRKYCQLYLFMPSHTMFSYTHPIMWCLKIALHNWNQLVSIQGVIWFFICFFLLQGLGKKKVDNTHKSKFIPDFIAWVPHKVEISQAGPMESVYNDTFRESSRPQCPQILVNTISKPKYVDLSKSNAFKDPVTIDPPQKPVTTYQFTHRHKQPNINIITNMNTGSTVEQFPVPEQKTARYINPKVPSIYDRPKSTSLTRMRKSRIASAPIFRSSVADCMRWHDVDEIRPQTASGHFPAISPPNNNSQSSVIGSQFSQTVPTLSSQTSMSMDYNGNLGIGNQQPSTMTNHHQEAYIKTSRVPATQIVNTTETNFNPSSSSAPVAPPVQGIAEEGWETYNSHSVVHTMPMCAGTLETSWTHSYFYMLLWLQVSDHERLLCFYV